MQDALALLFQTWIVYVNRVGSEDGVLFSGGSRVVDPFGRESGALTTLEPGSLEVALSGEAMHRARITTPLRRDEKPWLVQRGARAHPRPAGDLEMGALDIQCDLVEQLLVRFLRSEAGKFGFQRALVGLSGGVDSAVSAALCARAFGPKNVLGLRLPYKTSQPRERDRRAGGRRRRSGSRRARSTSPPWSTATCCSRTWPTACGAAT